MQPNFILSLREKNETPNKLAPREKQCVEQLALGMRTHQIAQILGIKDVTVNLYLANAKQKLSVRTREQLVAKSILKGYILLETD